MPSNERGFRIPLAWESVDEIIELLLRASYKSAAHRAHARRAGTWAEAICCELPCAPEPAFMRRCSTIADLDPELVSQIPQLGERYARVLRAYQESAIIGLHECSIPVAAHIIEIARAFDEVVEDYVSLHPDGLEDAIRTLIRRYPQSAEIIVALARAVISADIGDQ